MSQPKLWLPLESDPNSLNGFLQKLGQPHLHFVDILGFQEDALTLTPQPVHALLLLHPLGDKAHVEDTPEHSGHNEATHEHVWFLKQTISNACGTVALLNMLGNLQTAFPLEKNSVAEIFFKKIHKLSPAERGKELEKDETIAALHQSFAEAGVTEVGDISNVTTHFIAFVEVGGHLFELDGRKSKPVDHGATTTKDLLKDAAKIIEKKFVATAAQENKHSFSALALVTADATTH